MKKLLFVCIVILFNSQLFAQDSKLDLEKLELNVQKTIARAYNASVAISLYDGVKGIAGGNIFSGVVIDTAGHILSVAHAVKANTLYQVSFPDGKKMLARGLGTIASSDAAMLKITEKGKWPFAPMGWSSSMQPNMPCISISYPAVVAAKTPTVRLGYIAELQAKNGFMRSTCLMEPGDSGGPLFDMMGRVIGLHSRIDMSLDANFEVPVDTYRKHWESLIKSENLVSVRTGVTFPADPKSGELTILPGIQHLDKGLDKKMKSTYAQTVFKVRSPYRSRKAEATLLATLIKMDGVLDKKSLKNKSFLISKSSMVNDVVTVELAPGMTIPAKVISRDVANDLVLLQIDQKLKNGVNLNAVSGNQVMFDDLGKLLASPRPKDEVLMSIISNTPIDVPKRKSDVYTGLSAKSIGGKVIVANVIIGSGAAQASMASGDELLSINGKPILTENDFQDELESYVKNDTVNLTVVRKGVRLEKRLPVRLRQQSMEEMHMAYHFADGRSDRRSDFSNVMVHDGRLKPAECGGPLFDINGTFYGINIARFSRTSSWAIPGIAIQKFVKESVNF